MKEAKRLQEEAKKEYEHEEQRTRLQEDAIRQANQKMADKMATVSCYNTYTYVCILYIYGLC